MKRCTACNRTYPDTAQTFCIEDGTRLVDDTTTAPDGAPNYQQQAYQQQQAPIAQQPYVAAPYPQSTGMQPPQQNFQSAQQPAGSGSKSSRKGLFIALGLVAISFIGMAAIVIGLELWNNGTLAEWKGNNKSSTYSDTPSTSSKTTSTPGCAVSLYPPQFGGWKRTKAMENAEAVQEARGLTKTIMNAATTNAAAVYAGPGGKQVAWTCSSFSTPEGADTLNNDTITNVRANKGFKVVESSYRFVFTDPNGSAVALGRSITRRELLMYYADDLQTLNSFMNDLESATTR